MAYLWDESNFKDWAGVPFQTHFGGPSTMMYRDGEPVGPAKSMCLRGDLHLYEHAYRCPISAQRTIWSTLDPYGDVCAKLPVDTVVHCCGRDFHVNRRALIGGLPLVKEKFGSILANDKQPKIDLSEIDPTNILTAPNFHSIIRWLYGFFAVLNLENIYGLHKAADLLGVALLSERCIEYLIQQTGHSYEHLRRQNAVKIWLHLRSGLSGIDAALNKTCHFIRDNFGAIIRQGDFLSLEWKDVKEIIEMKNPTLYFENDVLNAALIWLNADWPARRQMTASALQAVFLATEASSSTNRALRCDTLLSLHEFIEKLEHDPVLPEGVSEEMRNAFKHLRGPPMAPSAPLAPLSYASNSEVGGYIYFCFQDEERYKLRFLNSQRQVCSDAGYLPFNAAQVQVREAFAYRHHIYILTQEKGIPIDWSPSPLILHKMKGTGNGGDGGHPLCVDLSYRLVLPKQVSVSREPKLVRLISSDSHFGLIWHLHSFGVSNFVVLLYDMAHLPRLMDQTSHVYSHESPCVDEGCNVLPCIKVIDDPFFVGSQSTKADTESFFMSGSYILGRFTDKLWNRDYQVPRVSVFNFDSNTVHLTPSPVQPSEHYSAQRVGEREIYIVGFMQPGDLSQNAISTVRSMSWCLDGYYSGWTLNSSGDRPNLKTARVAPKLIKMNDCLYVFGGRQSASDPCCGAVVKSIEKLDLTWDQSLDTEWEVVAQLHDQDISDLLFVVNVFDGRNSMEVPPGLLRFMKLCGVSTPR